MDIPLDTTHVREHCTLFIGAWLDFLGERVLCKFVPGHQRLHVRVTWRQAMRSKVIWMVTAMAREAGKLVCRCMLGRLKFMQCAELALVTRRLGMLQGSPGLLAMAAAAVGAAPGQG